MKYLGGTQVTRDTIERVRQWRNAKDSSDAILQGQGLLNRGDARKRLEGIGQILEC